MRGKAEFRHDGFYLLHVSGGTEPSIVAGPYQGFARFLKRAAAYAADRESFRDEYDGLFYIEVKNGRPRAGAFTGDQLKLPSPEEENEDAPRIPCPSGECGGVIEADGHCSQCGKYYKDEDHA